MTSSTQSKPSQPLRIEFIALMAVITSMVALAIDTVLPALGVIGDTFGVHSVSEKQLLITMIFLGIGMGQMFAGALSDSFGRKPIVYLGFGIFVMASILSVLTNNFEMLVFSRFLQGFGLSAPRTVSTAIIRDSYSGDEMAKVMSFISMTFIIVPTLAPMLGSAILSVAGWQAIFYSQAVIAVLACLWFAMRQPETLAVVDRARLSPRLFTNSIRTFFSEKPSVIYTLGMGLALGSFMTFLSTSETILIKQYGKQAEFPYLFGMIALAMGLSMLINGKLVTRFGMRKMVRFGTSLFTVLPILFVLICWLFGQFTTNPPLWVFMAFMMMQVFSIGFVFGNLTALSLEPLGKIAGMASAISGFCSTVLAVIYAGLFGQFITNTALPLFTGFLVAGLGLNVCLWWAKK